MHDSSPVPVQMTLSIVSDRAECEMSRKLHKGLGVRSLFEPHIRSRASESSTLAHRVKISTLPKSKFVQTDQVEVISARTAIDGCTLIL